MFDYNGYFLDNERKILYFNPKIETIESLDKKDLRKIEYKGEKFYLNLDSKSICPFHLECRGCPYIHLDYIQQFDIKKEQFDYIFRTCDVKKEYFKDNRYNYKEKIRVHVSLQNNNIIFNLNGEKPDLFFPCKIINEKINDFIIAFNNFKFESNLNDLFSFNEVFISNYDSKIIIKLKKNYNIYDKLLIKKLQLLNYKDLIIDDTDLQMSYKIKTDKEYELFYFSDSFIQSNSNINQKMITFIYDYLKNQLSNENEKIDLYDFFGGNGNLSIGLSSIFSQIFVIESNKKSKLNLDKSNEINKTGLEFLNCDLEKTIPILSKNKKVAILDPPRIGVYDRQLKIILENFDYVIYVSCNPLIIKRQLKIIKKFHEILNISIFDNFGYTKYFESIIVSKRK
ncbi:MAG: hypothetical protein PHT94_04210 [Candidatus Nanoarchaeia archaeon]|nr:hypothetical protein [Candidatus Nanoarchaeia archaeon]